jgi:hypothetical protein
MGVVTQILFIATLISLIGVAATYDPLDTLYFWHFWAVGVIFFGSGYMLDLMFGGYNTFVYDPNPINWRRKTDPQY